MDDIGIGKTVRRLRMEHGLSQEELGFKVGMTQSQVSLIEKNGTDHISTVKMFADVFGMDWIELLRMSEE